jgi:hypothetical protein
MSFMNDRRGLPLMVLRMGRKLLVYTSTSPYALTAASSVRPWGRAGGGCEGEGRRGCGGEGSARPCGPGPEPRSLYPAHHPCPRSTPPPKDAQKGKRARTTDAMLGYEKTALATAS